MFNTIGVLPEEIAAYNLVTILIYSSVSCLILLTGLELGFFCLYNSKFHPFGSILILEGTHRLYETVVLQLYPDHIPGKLTFLTMRLRLVRCFSGAFPS